MKQFKFNLPSWFSKKEDDNMTIKTKTALLSGTMDYRWKNELISKCKLFNISFTAINDLEKLVDKITYDFYIFTITPEPNQTLIETIAFMIDLSNKYKEKVVLCLLDDYYGYTFNKEQIVLLNMMCDIIESNSSIFVNSIDKVKEYMLGFINSIYVTKLSFRNIEGKPIDRFIGFCKENKLESAKKIIDRYMIHSYYGKIIPIHEYPAYVNGIVLEEVSCDKLKEYGIEVTSSITDYFDNQDFKFSKWRYSSLDHSKLIQESIEHVKSLMENSQNEDPMYEKITWDFIELKKHLDNL